MTNNTTAALTDDEREKLIDLVDRLIRNPDAVTAKDCIIGDDVRTVQWIAEHTRALLTSPRAAVPAIVEAIASQWDDCMFEGIGHDINIGASIRDAYRRLDAAPAAPVAEAKPAENAELARMTRMFHAACADLGLINEALGLDPDDGGAEPILDAIQKLKDERNQWADAGYAAQAVDADGAHSDRVRWALKDICREAGTDITPSDRLSEAFYRAMHRYFGAAVSPATAESKCTRCGSSTAQACNELGCFYLESGEGEPASADERAAASSEADDVGNWLWSELMDYCRERGIAPATAGRLFQIVSRARAKFAPQPAQADAPASSGPVSTWPGYKRGFNDGRKAAAPALKTLSVMQDEIAGVIQQHMDDNAGVVAINTCALSIARHVMQQATAPADAISLLRKAHRTLACAALTQIRDGEAVWTEIGRFLDAAPAEAREPVATFDDGLKVYLDSWTGGRHEAGSFGEVTLRFTDERHTTVRDYRAKDIAPADAGEAVARAYPDALTEDLRHVLGFPNFRCGPYAHLMRAAGADIQRKAEDEQAHVLHWLVKLVIDHGERWADVAQEELDAMREKVAGHQGAQGGKGGDRADQA